MLRWRLDDDFSTVDQAAAIEDDLALLCPPEPCEDPTLLFPHAAPLLPLFEGDEARTCAKDTGAFEVVLSDCLCAIGLVFGNALGLVIGLVIGLLALCFATFALESDGR